MGVGRIVIVLCAACTLAGFSPRDSDPGRLTNAFFKVVFGLEYGSVHADAQRVKKYADTVRFYVEDRSSSGRRREAIAFLSSLPSMIRHFKSTVIGHEDRANFKVVLVDRDAFNDAVTATLKADAVAMGARCIVGVKTRGGRILSSTAIIVADDEYLFRRCLVEEVLQGLGPMNDDRSLTESVFNDASRHDRFTAFDQALLNILYHPQIRPGMTGTQVHRALPGILADLGYHR